MWMWRVLEDIIPTVNVRQGASRHRGFLQNKVVQVCRQWTLQAATSADVILLSMPGGIRQGLVTISRSHCWCVMRSKSPVRLPKLEWLKTYISYIALHRLRSVPLRYIYIICIICIICTICIICIICIIIWYASLYASLYALYALLYTLYTLYTLYVYIYIFT